MSTPPPTDDTVAAIRARVAAWRAAGERVGFVPTMGALHAGHLALVRTARRSAERVVVSVFVNPTQFAPTEDFGAYPRDLSGDLSKLASVEADAVFAPTTTEMYPQGFATQVSVGGPAIGLETDFRPHFFAGVATVVAKLLIAVGPDVAVFGEKDFQQFLVVRRLVADLRLPVEVVGHPIEREADGLALSSRNAYLSPEERATAPEIYAALAEAALAIRSGTDAQAALSAARGRLAASGFVVDYVELRNAEDLSPAETPPHGPLRLLAAARLGRTRLIDNIPL
ncbi:MAG: pantoate--beta-alanine ligase [Bauldia sp.]|nr:pantoate--beta-alanine ligase [Bauldia sp.]